MYEFKLPDLGEGIHEGEVLKWHVAPGDEIGEDEIIIVCMSGRGDKDVQEVMRVLGREE